MKAGRKRWVVLAALAFYEIFLFGPSVSTVSVFFTPLMQQFHWSHADVSALATALDVSLGVCSLLAGWLLDRFEVRWVMTAGAVVAGASLLAASQSHSLAVMITCYAVAGLGVSLGFLVAVALIANNWFPGRTGLAIGLANVGVAIGLAVAPRIIAAVVAHAGWRVGMAAAGLPMVVLAAPVALIFLRTRPAEAVQVAPAPGRVRADEPDAAGLSVAAALRTVPMWLLVLVSLLFGYGLGAVYFHTVPYLVSVGISVATATLVFGAPALLYGLGGIVWGAAADRFGARRVILCAFVLFALSILFLLGAGPHSHALVALVIYMLLWGMDSGAVVAIPVLLVKTMGTRSYAGLNGILNFATQAGQGAGPLVAGVLIDRTHSYTLAFEVAAAAVVLSALLGALVRKPRWQGAGHEAAV